MDHQLKPKRQNRRAEILNRNDLKKISAQYKAEIENSVFYRANIFVLQVFT